MRHRQRRKPPGTTTPSAAYRHRASRRLYPPPANDPEGARRRAHEDLRGRARRQPEEPCRGPGSCSSSKHRGRAAFRVEEERRTRLVAELQQARLTGFRFKVPAETMSAKLADLPDGGCRSSAAGSRCGSTGRRTPWCGSTRWPRRSGTTWDGFRRSSVVEPAREVVTGMTTEALAPAAAEPAIATGGGEQIVLPQVIVDAGPSAVARFLEFFAGRIANARTRAAYGRAVGQFPRVVRGARSRTARCFAAPRGRLHPDPPRVGPHGEAAPGRDPHARRLSSARSCR